MYPWMNTCSLRAATAAALGLTLAACQSMPATTIDGPDAFRAHALSVDLHSGQAPESVARCFEGSAALLPTATLTSFPESRELVYRLRASRFIFETITFAPDGAAGTRVLVQVTPDYSARMRRDFVANRLAPLYLCVGTDRIAEWPAVAATGTR